MPPQWSWEDIRRHHLLGRYWLSGRLLNFLSRLWGLARSVRPSNNSSRCYCTQKRVELGLRKWWCQWVRTKSKGSHWDIIINIIKKFNLRCIFERAVQLKGASRVRHRGRDGQWVTFLWIPSSFIGTICNILRWLGSLPLQRRRKKSLRKQEWTFLLNEVASEPLKDNVCWLSNILEGFTQPRNWQMGERTH